MGRGFRLGSGRGDSDLGQVVAVESKEEVDVRVPVGQGEDRVVRPIPRACLGSGWLGPFSGENLKEVQGLPLPALRTTTSQLFLLLKAKTHL